MRFFGKGFDGNEQDPNLAFKQLWTDFLKSNIIGDSTRILPAIGHVCMYFNFESFSWRNLDRSTMENPKGTKRAAQGDVETPDAKRQQVPNPAVTVPVSKELLPKVEMIEVNAERTPMLPNHRHRKGDYANIPLQVPGQNGNGEVGSAIINYSRGKLDDKKPATWPDRGCYLSDTAMAEIIEANFTPNLCRTLWPLNFDANGRVFLKRPSMGYPAVRAAHGVGGDFDTVYTVYRHATFLLGDEGAVRALPQNVNREW